MMDDRTVTLILVLLAVIAATTIATGMWLTWVLSAMYTRLNGILIALNELQIRWIDTFGNEE